MKELVKKIITWKLGILAQWYLAWYKPQIVAITGNTGKTTTKEAIAAVLKDVKKIRSGKGNLNNEFGVPLTILGDWADEYYDTGNSPLFWAKVLWSSFFSLPFHKNYPEVLILEYGADKPGDIKKLCAKYKPHVSVVTGIGEIPVHVEYFSGPQELASEKANLVKHLNPNDYAILNHDDPLVYEMKSKTKGHVLSYGFTDGANALISHFDLKIDDSQKPVGINFKINYADSPVPFMVKGNLGKGLAYACAAAVLVGVIYDISPAQASEALENFTGPKGRMRILKGIKNSIIIDDTYNSSPTAMELAFETLKSLSAERKIVVVGDMLELGKYTIQAHQKIGNTIGGQVDVLVCVGARAKFIGDAAANQMSAENIYYFETSDLAKKKVQELIQEGDLILVKGSQGMRMEKIVEEIMAEPEKKKELLVRQGQKWLNK